eukprot:253769_1
MGAVQTVADVVTDNKQYYNCPKCGSRVWAYGSYVGNVCMDCPGTFTSAIVHTTDNVTLGLTSTLVDAVTDTRISYNCPRCNDEVWAYGAGVGKVCVDCRKTSGKLFSGADILNVNISGNTSSNSSKDITSDIVGSDKVKHVRVRSTTIFNKALSTLNGIGQILNDQNIEHWWCEIETKNNKYYIAHFCKSNGITLSKYSSSSGVDHAGKNEANRSGSNVSISTKYTCDGKNRTMNEVKSWVQGRNNNWNLQTNNCQHFCNAFTTWL